jgi:uncharacterized protein YjbI with pentapeptide repeats
MTDLINPMTTVSICTENYEVIENEVLKNSDLSDLTISGSLFSLTHFHNVTFRSCVFFASKMENCDFLGCKFIDCSFQFSNIEHCNFISVDFELCHWDTSRVAKTSFSSCFLDAKTVNAVFKESNKMEGCFAHHVTHYTDAA